MKKSCRTNLGRKLNEAMILSFEPSAIFLTSVLVLSSSLANFVRIVNITRSKNGCKWTSISFQLIECLFFKAPSFLKKEMETELASLVVTLYRKLSLSLHLPFSFSMIFVSEPTITASVSARFHRSLLRCTAG